MDACACMKPGVGRRGAKAKADPASRKWPDVRLPFRTALTILTSGASDLSSPNPDRILGDEPDFRVGRGRSEENGLKLGREKVGSDVVLQS